MFDSIEDYERFIIGTCLWKATNVHLRDILDPHNFINGPKAENGRFVNAILWELMSETKGFVFKIGLMNAYMEATNTKTLEGSVFIQSHITKCFYSYHAITEPTAAFILLEHAMFSYLNKGVLMLMTNAKEKEHKEDFAKMHTYIMQNQKDCLETCEIAVSYLLQFNNDEGRLFAKSFQAGFTAKLEKLKHMREEARVMNEFQNLEFTQIPNRPFLKTIQEIIKYMGVDKCPSTRAQAALYTLRNELL